LSAHFAMVISPASTVSAGHDRDETPSAEMAGLLAQAAAGPGFWEDLPAPRGAPCCIPGLAGRNLEDIPGSDGLLKIRKVKGTIACQETSGRAKAYGRGAGGPARYG